MLAFITSWLTPGSLFLLLNIVILTIYIFSSFTSSKHPHYIQPEPEHPAPLLARPPSFLYRLKSFDFSSYNYTHPIPGPGHNSDVGSDHDADVGSGDTVFDNPTGHYYPRMLERVKSINFNPYKFTPTRTESDYISDPNPENEAPEPEFRQPARVPSFLERVKSFDFTRFSRSDSIKENRESEFTPDMTTREPGPIDRSRSDGVVIERKKMKKSGSGNLGNREDKEEVERRRPESARLERNESIGGSIDVDAEADNFITKFRQQLMMQRLESLRRCKDMFKGKVN